MKKLTLLILILSCTRLLNAQCDRLFAPSGSVEFMNDMGFIVQGGVTGQNSPLSIQVGARATELKDTAYSKTSFSDVKLFPRLEFGYRIVTGLTLAVAMARYPDVSLVGYKRIGDNVAVIGRIIYDKRIMVGAGIKFVIYYD